MSGQYLNVAPQAIKPGDEIQVRGRRAPFIVSLVKITETKAVRVEGERTAAGNKRTPLYFWPHKLVPVWREED
jgi:hypothetical protein